MINLLKPKYKEIVLGCSLESLIYCYFNKVPFLYSQKLLPHEYEFIDVEDLQHFFLSFTPKQLNGFPGPKLSKPQKRMIWDRLFLLLCVNGLSLMPTDCASIQIQENNIKAFTSHARMALFQFETLTVFDDKNVLGLPTAFRNNDMSYLVFDWVITRSMTPHSYDFLETQDDFIKEVIFYPSKRMSPCTQKKMKTKDMLVSSIIRADDLDTYEWSDIALRFKLLHLLKENGFKGRKNGFIDEKQQHKPLRIETIKRDIISLAKENIYKDTEIIKFNNKPYKQLLREKPEQVILEEFMRQLWTKEK